MNPNTETEIAAATSDTPRPCKPEPRFRRSRGTKAVKGAFGKCKNNSREAIMRNLLVEQTKLAQFQLALTGRISEPTAQAINRVFGPGAASSIAKALGFPEAPQGE